MFGRSRRSLIAAIVAAEDDAARTAGQARARRNQLASWLTSRAAGYDADANHITCKTPTIARAVATELRAAARDLDLEETGP